ncbi:hypothetical protein INT80_11145 [Gallibacterium anatis]|uniref:Minor extracellular protease Epr GA-like domain-containing protein n=1 Tax=Gallibacterium anatis TaxID=750 RepID=A0A930UX63_9PAST|nr:hypothetical protein [Gallibacterium anatis]
MWKQRRKHLKIRKGSKEGILAQPEQQELEQLKQDYDAKKADAKAKLAEVPEGESAYQGLKDKVDALPEVAYRHQMMRTTMALQIQKTLRMLKSIKTMRKQRRKHLKIRKRKQARANSSTEQELEQLKQDYDAKKADAKAKLAEVPEGESAYQGLKDKVDALPEVSVPTSDDANDNGHCR